MKNLRLSVGSAFLIFRHRLAAKIPFASLSGKSFLFNRLRYSLFVLTSLFLITSCSNDFDEYFKRPSWLEEPAYDALQSKGNFTDYLKLVNRTLYSSVLKGSGSYTFFAPNDDAFKIYLAGKSLTSVDQISDADAAKIVAYSLVYNSYSSAHLGDIAGTTWTEGGSVRKLTPYYKGIYNEDVSGVTSWVIDPYDQAGDASTTIMPYRYLSIFTPKYFSANGLSSSDYETFYNGMYNTLDNKINVMGASVLNQENGSPEIDVENGAVYEVNRVNADVTNIDEKLTADSKGNEFRNILNRKLSDGTYQFVSYEENTDNTAYYKKIYPSSNISHLYYKSYSLPFSFNVERSANTSNVNESDAQTLFVPTNTAVDTWKEKITSLYDITESEIPDIAWQYFLQAHMVDHLVWPSKYKSEINVNSEFLNGAGSNGNDLSSAGIDTCKMASNGFYYRINSVIPCGYFESIYGKMLMDKSYSYLNSIITNIYSTDLMTDFLKSPLKGYTEENMTLLLPSNALIASDGYTYDSSVSDVASRFTNSSLKGSTSAIERLKRIIRMGIFERVNNSSTNTSITDFSATEDGLADYNGYAYAIDYYGDMVRYKNNQLQWAGNITDGSKVTATKVVDKSGNNPYNNGQVFKIDGLPQYSSRNNVDSAAVDLGWNDQNTKVFISKYLKNNSEVSVFYKYWTALNSLIDIPTSKYYTILIPDNNSMNAAIAAGDMPAYSSLVPYAGTLNSVLSPAAVAFIYNHVLQGGIYPDDGKAYIIDNFKYYSTYTVSSMQPYTVSSVTNKSKATVYKGSGNVLTFKANNITNGATVLVKGGDSPVIVERGIARSNIIGPRAVIHEVNGYLKYTVQ